MNDFEKMQEILWWVMEFNNDGGEASFDVYSDFFTIYIWGKNHTSILESYNGKLNEPNMETVKALLTHQKKDATGQD